MQRLCDCVTIFKSRAFILLSSCVVENEVGPDEIELTEPGTYDTIVFTVAVRRSLQQEA